MIECCIYLKENKTAVVQYMSCQDADKSSRFPLPLQPLESVELR